MARQSYVQDPVTHELVPKEQYVPRHHAPTVFGDLPDFVSPIDQQVYSGRAGLREHCKLHNVVLMADCEGLPNQRPPAKANREEIRQALADVVYGRTR